MGNGTALRLTQISLSGDRYRVDMTLRGHGPLEESAFSIFTFSLTPQDREDLRWYLEDYPETTRDPGEEIARRIERRMAEIGKDLFTKIFQHDEDTREIWSAIRNALNEARMEIVTEVYSNPKKEMHV